MKIGNREFQTKGHTYVMGILNVTPDSFSDGGKFNDRDQALKHVEQMLTDGMDVLDIGDFAKMRDKIAETITNGKETHVEAEPPKNAETTPAAP